ncbi:F0F1 ATP synthase subunit B [Ketogulonicigenium vulgare]|uniref:ATP synthase subunit b n=1 Tax=Ketogulonicigenium vulgare (strain WSH-001) TaxID=759362 RepID=F9Y7I1_KETVW|nr:F0F1 ATP synthase subunit B [Ketogulonicigenium vulgare]ADO41287.1 ATP synthase F0, B subunit [Ketogulonicigenium vulgare Y25]AEM42277.1 H+-transporting two-sector ATPase, B/B' subunit [Ketogulonicigenium vulgare WSH-001]ALJ79896.1 ATP F0F1 synthase subunit B [Ketogulonicigenium vulgare]ANW32797.1 ATP F0F1 synthase subunit B [Ketogulonicigenium vulgare]AOZ53113.1 ATP synthase F0, B subunit [Ketogulonicigenium vulgare]
MRKVLSIAALLVGASVAPALAADGPFFSLRNTDFVVLLAFLLFIGVLIWAKVPALIVRVLDARAETIRAQLAEARALRDEAAALLASYEQKQKEVQEQAARIVEVARREAEAAAEKARADIETSVARRLSAAEDQIASAHKAAIKDVRDRAASVAIAAARDVIAGQMDATKGNKLIDDAIKTVDAQLH